MNARQLKNWLEQQLKEAEPLDKPSEMDDPRGVAIKAAKKLGLLCCGSGQLLERSCTVQTPAECAAVLIDCLAALPQTSQPAVDPGEQPDQRGMTVEEVAGTLRISKGALYERCSDGRFPCLRIGSRIVIMPEHLVEYQTQAQQQPQQSVAGLRHLT